MYFIGVGSLWNDGNGVNVIAPVVPSTDQVPSPGTVTLVISPLPSVLSFVAPAGTTKLTLVASIVPSASASSPDPFSTSGFNVTTEFAGFPELKSFSAVGGTFSYVIVTVA